MRRSTLLWLTLAAFSGTALFHTSQAVHDGREKLAKLNAAIVKEEDSLRVLTAEWSYLNQPTRLEKLAKAHLKLAPLKGHQFVKADDIPLRSAAVVKAEAAAPEPATTTVKEPVKPAPAVAEKTPAPPAAKKPAAAPVVKIIKPAPAVAAAPKPAAPPAAAAGTARNFSDLMKSLNP